MSDPTPTEKAAALGLVYCTTSNGFTCWKTPDGATHYSPAQLEAAYATLRRDGIAALTEALTDPRDEEIARLRADREVLVAQIADERRLWTCQTCRAREEGRREERARNVAILRERATTRRATADRMSKDNQHKDAATYYTYATAEECCATLIERGEPAKEPK